tara:strand:- start:673 stop:843 length:171 start_codon:yes stop_codon:yes gene_type:complete
VTYSNFRHSSEEELLLLSWSSVRRVVEVIVVREKSIMIVRKADLKIGDIPLAKGYL